MSSYNELIKNFEKIRNYMREFYVYGFKSRDEYQSKSARSYDDERRRLESWLGDHMSFVRTPEGKNVFISIDSRTIRHNPLYNTWKTKSFTDKEITLHFIIFDILHDPSVKLTLPEIIGEITGSYLSGFTFPIDFDESTIRKKLREYCNEGLLKAEKSGKVLYYSRCEDSDVSSLSDALHYFSEVSPCGVIGSFILDKTNEDTDVFTFKHHYITSAIDSEVLAVLFEAMREKRAVSVTNSGRRSNRAQKIRIIPLRIFISVQSGRQHLLAYVPKFNCFMSYRVDYLSDVSLGDVTPRFDELRAELDRMQKHAWGVRFNRKWTAEESEHVDFTVKINEDEKYILQRLEREKRVGKVEKLDSQRYRFSADVHDTNEMIPWIRTFICRITDINFSNKALENKFRNDLEKMYEIYGIGEEENG